jgi:hypothetical protein
MRTTVTIDREVADRAAKLCKNMGHNSMSKSVEFLTRKACDFIETNGYDEFVKIPSGNSHAERKLDTPG